MLVLTTKDIIYMHDMHPIPGNTILEVEKNGDSKYRVTRGMYERVVIDASKCIPYEQPAVNYSAMHQELLQRRQEVTELMKLREFDLGRIEGFVSERRDCLRIIELQKEEIHRSQNEVRVAREAKKVILPREVAEALEDLKGKGNGLHMILNFIRTPKGNSSLILAKYCQRNLENMLAALVNEYTIEEQQTFTTNRKLDVSEIRALRNWYEGAVIRMNDGRDPDGFCREAIEEVVLYLGGAKLLEGMSEFCRNQLKREKAQQSG